MRAKLLLWLLLPLVSLCCLSTVIVSQLAEQFANASFDTYLENSADSIIARLSRDSKGIIIADLPYAAQAVLRHHGNDKFYYQIVDSNRVRLTGDSILPLPRDNDRLRTHFRFATVDGQPVRICRVPVQLDSESEPLWVQVAETLNTRQKLLHQIVLSVLIPQLALVALGCLSVWIGVKFGLRSLYQLCDSLQRRAKLDFSPIDTTSTPGELLPVTSALNALFQDADKHLHAQQQFIGNAAHQLRTPITALKTYIDYLQRINDSSGMSNILAQVAEVTNRLVHMTNRLLVLARAEGQTQRPAQLVDLSAAVDEAASAIVQSALSKGVELHFDTPADPVLVYGDSHDLTEMVTNLLENAVMYTQTTGSVWLTVESKQGVRLSVADDGPGIPEEERQKIFQRFYRAASSNKSGCGLGLSIVGEIANRYHAEIEVTDRNGGGAVFTVSFPTISGGTHSA